MSKGSLKRNKTNHRHGGGGVSPYVKYSKVPYRYSEKYQAWKATVTRSSGRV